MTNVSSMDFRLKIISQKCRRCFTIIDLCKKDAPHRLRAILSAFVQMRLIHQLYFSICTLLCTEYYGVCFIICYVIRYKSVWMQLTRPDYPDDMHTHTHAKLINSPFEICCVTSCVVHQKQHTSNGINYILST